MSTTVSSAGSPAFCSIREAAWALGVAESEVCRLIRAGVLPTVRRRSRLVVPVSALARLLPAPVEGVAL
ncbi:hypothetical protein EV193_112127 [Herbihabitans rhizosphaerae]|uniref:Excisionase family DNA binding protein n=1 Tax=Herbihabitans rhizosphaerae TaxID=1872711 RepID=A0A4Q7KF22_9PSEU|nr:hypothetical protein EV193_112127 [Herbihabitans rhizosphaerae]